MADEFSSSQPSLLSPFTKAVAITPDDATDLVTVARAIYVGGAGNISMILNDDTVAVTFTGVLVGTILSVRAKRIRATLTTATLIVALS